MRWVWKISAFLATMAMATAQASPVIDGNVQGFGEDYQLGFFVHFDVEGGKNEKTVCGTAGCTGVQGGFFYVDESSTTWSFGLIVPLTLNDNTYGANKASDWTVTTFNGGTRDIIHNLIDDGGGKSLEGSDKWEVLLPVIDGADVYLKLDYIDASNNDTTFDTRIERAEFGKGGAEIQNINDLVVFETSLSYNFEKLGLTVEQLAVAFGPTAGSPESSPSTTGGNYNFDAPFQDWVPEIMYEFSIEKSVFGDGRLDLASLAAVLGIVHMSPNKLGGNKVYAFDSPISTPNPNGPSVPEPGTLALLGIGLLGLGIMRRRRKAA